MNESIHSPVFTAQSVKLSRNITNVLYDLNESPWRPMTMDADGHFALLAIDPQLYERLAGRAKYIIDGGWADDEEQISWAILLEAIKISLDAHVNILMLWWDESRDHDHLEWFAQLHNEGAWSANL